MNQDALCRDSQTDPPRTHRVPAVGAALLPSKRRRSPRVNMNGKHTLLFNPVRAPSPRARSHKVQTKHTLVAIITLLATAACHKQTSVESRLIGTWSSPALTIVYEREPSNPPPPLASQFMEITFTPDHKQTWRYRGGAVEAVARWRVEGNDVVTTMETKSFFGGPGIMKREKITKITSDELVFSDGTNEGRWTRVR